MPELESLRCDNGIVVEVLGNSIRMPLSGKVESWVTLMVTAPKGSTHQSESYESTWVRMPVDQALKLTAEIARAVGEAAVKEYIAEQKQAQEQQADASV
jgi:hypothetical protein